MGSIRSIIGSPIKVNNLKKMTIIKKGFQHLIKQPSILFNIEKNIALHFDLHHGNGNLNKAISVLDPADQKILINMSKNLLQSTYYVYLKTLSTTNGLKRFLRG